MARDANAAGRFADVISRAKDELVTPDEYMAFAMARREAFDIMHGQDAFEAALAGLREREALGNLWQVRVVRTELANRGLTRRARSPAAKHAATPRRTKKPAGRCGGIASTPSSGASPTASRRPTCATPMRTTSSA
jgi:hypothetical protein